MTDHTRSVHDAEDAMEEMDDLELITMAVNGHLSPSAWRRSVTVSRPTRRSARWRPRCC